MKYLLFLFVSITAFGSPQGVPGEATATCGTSSGVLVAANPNRGYLILQSQGSDTTGHCHVKFGVPITGTEGMIVNSGQNWEVVQGFLKQAVYCKCDSASQVFEIAWTNY